MLKLKEKSQLNYKSLITEIIFILIIALLFYNSNFIYINKLKWEYILIVIASIGIMSIYSMLFKEKYSLSISKIRGNKKCIYIASYYVIVVLLLNNIFINISNQLILVLINILVLFILFKICKIKLNFFNFKTSFSWILISVVISYFLILIRLSTKNTYGSIIDFFINICVLLITNYGMEEVIFRGCIFSGLIKFNINPVHINIIQSIIFAICHLGSVGRNLNCLPYYILYGYLFGKIYSTSGSLTPGIVLHGIFNLFYS